MSAQRPPSSYKVMLAGDELAQLRETLRAIDPTIEEDQRLFADMLEGEGGDALEVIKRLIDVSNNAERFSDMVSAERADLKIRKARFDRRRETCRAAALQVLERINLRYLERPGWTVSLREMPPSVRITDESRLLDTYIRITQSVDKEAIARDLKAGKIVPGAELSNGGTGLSVRTK